MINEQANVSTVGPLDINLAQKDLNMKLELKWTEGMRFQADCDTHSVNMDAKSPIGNHSAMTPKELVGAGLGGCTAMDVIALLKKHRQSYESLVVDIDISTSSGGQPVVFTGATLAFKAKGQIEPSILLESVRLSQTKYCGVSAMLVKAFPIRYTVSLNDQVIGEGHADFSESH